MQLKTSGSLGARLKLLLSYLIVIVIAKVGSELVAAGNFHGEEVREIVQSLSQEWKQLSSASAKKG